jgi:hypothetical protein
VARLDNSCPASVGSVMDGIALEPELARQFQESLRTWQRRRRARLGPPYIRVGRRIYYRVEAVREWFSKKEKLNDLDIRGPPRRRMTATDERPTEKSGACWRISRAKHQHQ